MNIQELQQFEETVAELFQAKKIHCPIHLSKGNEKQLIHIFKSINKNDYVFSTHRNHYHYLLHTGNWKRLIEQIIMYNDSMHTCDPEHHFYSSSIVAGCVAIACGVALALKMKKSKQKVWCFVGDGAIDEGWFMEAFKYTTCQDLPIIYIIEDNNRSVMASIKQRWGKHIPTEHTYLLPLNGHIAYNEYKCGYPHCGIGKFVTF